MKDKERVMVEPQNAMPIKHIVDSNIVCDPSHGEILLHCADTWVDEDSLLTSYQEIIQSHWIEQGVIEVEEKYFQNKDNSTKIISGEHKNGGTSSSMQMNEMSEEQSSNYDEGECELRHTQCE